MEFFCECQECFNVATEHNSETGMAVCERHYSLDWEWNEPEYEPYSDWELDADWEDFMFEARNYH